MSGSHTPICKNSSGSETTQAVVTEIIASNLAPAFTAVTVDDSNQVLACDASLDAFKGRFFGITKEANTVINSTVEIVLQGTIYNPSWTFTPGAPLFVGTAGAIVEDFTGLAFRHYLGYAIDATTVYIDASFDRYFPILETYSLAENANDGLVMTIDDGAGGTKTHKYLRNGNIEWNNSRMRYFDLGDFDYWLAFDAVQERCGVYFNRPRPGNGELGFIVFNQDNGVTTAQIRLVETGDSAFLVTIKDEAGLNTELASFEIRRDHKIPIKPNVALPNPYSELDGSIALELNEAIKDAGDITRFNIRHTYDETAAGNTEFSVYARTGGAEVASIQLSEESNNGIILNVADQNTGANPRNLIINRDGTIDANDFLSLSLANGNLKLEEKFSHDFQYLQRYDDTGNARGSVVFAHTDNNFGPGNYTGLVNYDSAGTFDSLWAVGTLTNTERAKISLYFEGTPYYEWTILNDSTQLVEGQKAIKFAPEYLGDNKRVYGDRIYALNHSLATTVNLVPALGSEYAITLNSISHLVIQVEAIDTITNEVAEYKIEATVKNIAGTTTLVSKTITRVEENAAFDCDLVVDDILDEVRISVTNAAANLTRWSGKLDYRETLK